MTTPPVSKPTYYDILKITPDYPSDAIRDIRRGFSRMYHADTGASVQDQELMAQINAACDVLEDEEKRAEYDRKLAAIAAAESAARAAQEHADKVKARQEERVRERQEAESHRQTVQTTSTTHQGAAGGTAQSPQRPRTEASASPAQSRPTSSRGTGRGTQPTVTNQAGKKLRSLLAALVFVAAPVGIMSFVAPAFNANAHNGLGLLLGLVSIGCAIGLLFGVFKLFRAVRALFVRGS